MTDLTTRAGRIEALKAAAKERILILDGSWGVMFQKKKLTEADYRAERFADYDGQKLKLGETTLVAHLTPGHTIGCTTWTTQVVDRDRPLNVTFPCSASVAGNVLVGNKTYRNIVADYRATFATLKALPTDVMLPSHEEQGNLLAKRKKMLAGDVNAFVDPGEIVRYATASEAAFDKELARQQAAQKP